MTAKKFVSSKKMVLLSICLSTLKYVAVICGALLIVATALVYHVVSLYKLEFNSGDEYLGSVPRQFTALSQFEFISGRSGAYVTVDGIKSIINDTSILIRLTAPGFKVISRDVSSVMCTDTGVAYMEGSNLYCCDGGKPYLVKSGVSSYCWNGSRLIYAVEDAVYSMGDSGEELLFETDGGNYFYMVANEDYIVLMNWDSLFYFETASDRANLLKWQGGSVSGEEFYLYENYLIILCNSLVCDLSSGTEIDIDGLVVGRDTHCWSRGTALDGKLYFTIKTIFANYKQTIDTRTVVIDVNTWKSESLNDKWFPLLWNDGKHVGGWGNGAILGGEETFE